MRVHLSEAQPPADRRLDCRVSVAALGQLVLASWEDYLAVALDEIIALPKLRQTSSAGSRGCSMTSRRSRHPADTTRSTLAVGRSEVLAVTVESVRSRMTTAGPCLNGHERAPGGALPLALGAALYPPALLVL